MEYVYVVQHHVFDSWEDDGDFRPFDSYWDAVIAAMQYAKQYGVSMRVVKRYVEQEVFVIDGEAK